MQRPGWTQARACAKSEIVVFSASLCSCRLPLSAAQTFVLTSLGPHSCLHEAKLDSMPAVRSRVVNAAMSLFFLERWAIYVHQQPLAKKHQQKAKRAYCILVSVTGLHSSVPSDS